MKITVHITSLDNRAGTVWVKAQGAIERAAKWRSYSYWEFTVPDYTGKKYRLGQKLRITVEPKP